MKTAFVIYGIVALLSLVLLAIGGAIGLCGYGPDIFELLIFRLSLVGLVLCGGVAAIFIVIFLISVVVNT